MALALLSQSWAAGKDGTVYAIIVDHGLRDSSAAEAATTRSRLAGRGIAADIVTLSVPAGSGLQARARAARYLALTQVAKARGCLHLLLGHHAADQAETVAMRQARGPRGLEGMAGWAARNDVLLLRPLLAVAPERLRSYLRSVSMAWVEDPSNGEPRFERARVRASGVGTAAVDPQARRREEGRAAAFLAGMATLRPEGFAVIHAEAAPAAALAALLRVVGGAEYAPARRAVAELAARLRPATLGGVRIVPAGKFGPGWLLAREPAACAPPLPAAAGVVWDGRFRVAGAPAQGTEVAALGADAARYRKVSDLPALVLRTMPCLRGGPEIVFPAPAVFAPPAPATSHPFLA